MMNTGSTWRPPKTKYHDFTCRRIIKSHHPHVSIFTISNWKARIEWYRNPYSAKLDRHVMDEDYRARRASSTFKHLRPEDFLFPLIPLSEWEHLDQEGVENTDALLIVGEILLASDKALGKCRCKPGLLRSCWTNIHAWKGVFLRRVVVKMGSLSSKWKFSRENWSEISIYFAK
jgi:hypothetical protein